MTKADFSKKLRLCLLSLAILAFPGQSFAQELKSRMSGMALSNDLPIQIESDQLAINDANSTATFLGNVNVVQGDTVLQSGKMIVHYASGGSVTSGATDIEKIELMNKVLLKTATQTATGDTGVYNMTNETFVLSGSEVILTEGKNVFIGCKLTVEMAAGDAKLDSCGKRVLIQLDPKSRKK